jgi:hypothetical protein
MARVIPTAAGLVALALWGAAMARADEPPAAAPQSTPPTAAATTAPSPAAKAVADDDDTTELIVQLKDGRRFTGPVVRQNSTEVVIALSGVPMRFAIEEIEKLETLEPLAARYRKLREAVGDNPDQIVRLAEWLQTREKYAIALTEVDRALAIDKGCVAAMKLKPILEQQVILQHARVKKEAAAAAGKGGGGGENEPTRPAAQRPRDFPLLSEADVQLIKVFETNFDEKPRLIIPRTVTQKLLEKYSQHPLVPVTREGRDAVVRQAPTEILDLMFKLQAREFYPQVEVLDQPHAFVAFRDQVCRTWLVNSCATTGCHGGTDGGRFVLFNGRPNSERTVYTNFYILTKYRLPDGTPLLNYDEPEKSLLLQFGLARERSRHPHPVVPRGVNDHDAFKPFFKSEEDVQYKAAVDWIKSLYRPRPDYPVSYTPIMPFEMPKAGPGPARGPANPAPAAPSAPPADPAPPAGAGLGAAPSATGDPKPVQPQPR